MLLEENQIAFHSEDGLIFDGVKDYARQIAEMIGLGSESEFRQAGVSLISILISSAPQHAGIQLCSKSCHLLNTYIYCLCRILKTDFKL